MYTKDTILFISVIKVYLVCVSCTCGCAAKQINNLREFFVAAMPKDTAANQEQKKDAS
jgi:hypothetical protein